MKLVKLPISRKTKDTIDKIIGTISIFLILLILGSLYSKEFDITFYCLILLIPSIYYHWKILLNPNVIYLTKDELKTTSIIKVDKNIITVTKENIETEIQWSEIIEIDLTKERDIIFKIDQKEKFKIENECEGWFYLLKNIQERKIAVSKKLETYINKIFLNLSPCEICGYFAVKDVECFNCLVDKFEPDMLEEFESKIEYIKEEQLDYFSIDKLDKKVVFYPEKNKFEVFKFNKNWKLLVTEAEVREYSKSNYIE